MSDDWGERDQYGEWSPGSLPVQSPLFAAPRRPGTILKYHFSSEGFFSPYNLFYSILAIFAWYFFIPHLSRTTIFRVGWIAEIYLRNASLVGHIASGLQLRRNLTKWQGLKFKYNNKWQAKQNKKIPFRNQTWTTFSGILHSNSCVST